MALRLTAMASSRGSAGALALSASACAAADCRAGTAAVPGCKAQSSTQRLRGPGVGDSSSATASSPRLRFTEASAPTASVS